MQRATILFLIGLLLSADISAGAVFKCKDEKGKTTFSDRPCPDKQEEVVREKPSPPKQSSAEQPQKNRAGYGNFIDRARQVKSPDP